MIIAQKINNSNRDKLLNVLLGEDIEDNEKDEVEEIYDENFDNEQSVYLPKSVTGSPRHMQKLACDALHAVAENGAPTEFVTLTVNISWREITEKLFANQTAFDRPDIVCQTIHFFNNVHITEHTIIHNAG